MQNKNTKQQLRRHNERHCRKGTIRKTDIKNKTNKKETHEKQKGLRTKTPQDANNHNTKETKHMRTNVTKNRNTTKPKNNAQKPNMNEYNTLNTITEEKCIATSEYDDEEETDRKVTRQLQLRGRQVQMRSGRR